MFHWLAIVAFALASATASSSSSDRALAWPQFRGPDGNGIAEDQKPPVEFGPNKNFTWKVAVPSGLSSPIVVGDKLVITAFENDKLYTIAYNRKDGSEAWRAEAPAKEIEPYNKTHGSPAASTCATDGKHIVSYFGSCGLICYDRDGHELWKYEMPTAFTLAGFGTGVSPIIVGESVVLMRDVATDSKIVDVDINTGQLKWEKLRQSKSSFGTPVLWKTPDGEYIVGPGYGKMIGYNAKDGSEDWFVEGMPAACCTTPVTADGKLFFAGWAPGDPDDKDFQMPTFDSVLKEHDTDKDGALSKDEALKTVMNAIFDNNDTNKDGKITRDEWDTLLKFSAASRNSAFALKPGGKGDVTSSMLWKQTKGLPYVSSAILYRGQYLMVKDGGMITAYDAASGKQLYQKRLSATGSYYASPVAANGNIYFVSLDDGTFTVLEGGAKSPTVVAQNPPLAERTAATPAIADDTLYVRTAQHLYAFKTPEAAR
jgi:outer membrane protein assembly factor BamB